MNLMNLLFSLIYIICILISVAFLTLLEQKLLSYIQIRKGPNKVGYVGILQPFSDAIKLFFKEYTIPINSNYSLYYVMPVMSLLISLFIWMCFPFLMNYLNFKLSFLFMLSCMSLSVYGMMISGWSSNSNYALLGSLRSIAQTVSYEVCMILIMLLFIVLILSMNLKMFLNWQINMNFIYVNYLMSFILFIIFLAETNRAPFDFAEGESELVSGFNIEYSSGGFALIFLSEYSSILFLSGLFCIFFMYNSVIFLLFYFKLTFMSFMFIWIRGAYPRLRYDKLMYLTWKIYLMIALFMLYYYFSMKFMCM